MWSKECRGSRKVAQHLVAAENFFSRVIRLIGLIGLIGLTGLIGPDLKEEERERPEGGKETKNRE